jgi:hypothetical protein
LRDWVWSAQENPRQRRRKSPRSSINGLEPKGDDGIVVTAVTVHNQREQLVLSGQHKYLLRRQRAVRNGKSDYYCSATGL